MKPRTKIMTCWPDWMLPTDVRSGRENLNESRNEAESGARSIKREVVLTRIFPQQQNYPHDATCSHTKFRDQNIFREDYTSSFMIHFVRNQDMSRCSDKTFDRLINPMAFLYFYTLSGSYRTYFQRRPNRISFQRNLQLLDLFIPRRIHSNLIKSFGFSLFKKILCNFSENEMISNIRSDIFEKWEICTFNE